MATNKPEAIVINPEQPSIDKALEIVKGKWRLSIILLLDRNTLRYGELRAKLPTVSEKVLSSELKALLLLGVLNRKVYAEVPPRVEYTLSERGLLALPALIQLKEVGRIFL
ncbi:winged helix-turn-helix transcriptional regulator [Spirosoma soli]|uniref:Winged helix-turn-helix transcriptional regulator n=1 Tax=Spirosoma soli TaxID=1770529 RepID=A0ABW5M8H5_9BACT